MKTPILDFLKQYNRKNFSRLHMPGHKGKKFLGLEKYDITEINGADVLYSASGIIDRSEQNATKLFGTAHTYYSTEGSTLAIKAMLHLALINGNNNKILATRNAHSAFMHACAMLNIQVDWLYAKNQHFCSCLVTAQEIEENLQKNKLFAVYITSPDYLGNIADISGISKVCNKYDVPLLVDNAHGAYSAFTTPNFHPINLGATMCVDSAHKTLPVLTGGAYLHIAQKKYCEHARNSLNLFASTSPSYLIMASLDMANAYLEQNKKIWDKTVDKINRLKLLLTNNGLSILSGEPLKMVINAKKIGYTGYEIADFLRKNKIEPEMADEDFTVLMFSPLNSKTDFKKVEKALLKLQIKQPIKQEFITFLPQKKAMTIAQATLYKTQTVKTDLAIGKIAGQTKIACPPAIPIIVSGEIISEQTVEKLKRFNIDQVEIIKGETD